jgi:hypothetical protein
MAASLEIATPLATVSLDLAVWIAWTEPPSLEIGW